MKEFRRTPGLTQRARGHKAAEHVTRREATIRRQARDDREVYEFAAKQSERGEAPSGRFNQEMSRSPDDIYLSLKELIAQKDWGMKRFRQLRDLINDLHERWLDNGAEPIGIDMDRMEAVWELPRVELFYH